MQNDERRAAVLALGIWRGRVIRIVHDLSVGATSFTNDDGEECEVPLDDALVSAFWLHSAATDSDSDKYFWAWEAVHRAAIEQVDGIVPFFVALADAVEGRLDDLAYLGAGPFEDLLRHGGPATPAILDELDDAARRNENVRLAVRAIWWGDNDDPYTVARFSRFGPTY